MNILITGVNGFIGKSLELHLNQIGDLNIYGTVRQPTANVRHINIGDISHKTCWKRALNNIDVIVHTAARAHQFSDGAEDNAEIYDEINVQGTIKLAHDAIANGVKRLIFISSIGVLGDNTYDSPFTENSAPEPVAAYAVSKLKAEEALMNIASQSKLEVVIIRPTLVYGSDAPGNFRKLIKVCRSPLPLPLGDCNNKRSFLYIFNLCDFIHKCIIHPNAANQVFVVADEEYVSTRELTCALRDHLGLSRKIFYFPSILLKIFTKIVGKEKIYKQLFGDLTVSINKAKNVLDWSPKVSTREALKLIALKIKQA